MKRLLSLIVFVLTLKISAFAQPTISFPNASPCSDSNPSFCMDVTVKDFTDILSMEFTIAWNPEVISLDQVAGFNLPGLNAGSFDQTNKADGYITLNWRFNDCTPNAVGVTLPDGRSIFRLCFTSLGDYGDTTAVRITNMPTDIKVTRVNACPNNIGLFTKDGVVSTCVRPLELIALQEEGNEGDLVCVDFKVKGFDDMTSMQFSINWDPSIIRFEDVVVLPNLVNLSESGFGTPEDPDIPAGVMTVSWAFVDPGGNRGITLPDSTSIFQVCYRIVGPCESSSPITFSATPTPIEVTNTVKEGFELTVLSSPGGVRVGDCDPKGLKLFADCGPEVNLNDEVCVKVTTAGFQGVLELDYLMEWNPNILRFKQVRIPAPAPLFGLDANDFETTNVVNGILGLEWSVPLPNLAQTKADGTLLYEVCFDVVGLGANSPIRFPTRPALVRTNTSPNLGINPTNCEVRVIQPAGVTLTMSNAEGAPGDTVCVDLTVANFRDILSAQFSLAWDTSHVTFLEPRDIALPGASATNFGVTGINGGSLTFSWDAVQGVTLNDGDRIFTLCFVVTGDPKDCEILQIVDLPLKTEVTSTESNGNNIGLTGQGGEICVLNPEGYTLIIDETEGFINDTICVPFRVADFDGITATTFTVNWDPTALGYVRHVSSGALMLDPNQNFDIRSADVGILTFKYQNVNGATLADSTVIFELCLALLGPKNACYDVTLNPIPTVTTLNGEGSVQLDAGEVCIKDRLVIEKVDISAVTCAGARDGAIELTVSGGTGQIFFNWGSTPVQFTNRARNLPVGQITVTIFDSNTPALTLRDTFDIPLTTNLPAANAGRDRFATCDRNSADGYGIFLLDGQGSTGNTFSYRWTTEGGTLPGDSEALRSVGRGPGRYILTVRNTETFCAVSDTVQILTPPLPQVNAGDDFGFDCSRDTFNLDGSRSAQADTIGYAWRALSGGAIVAGDEALLSPRITAPGTFVLQAFFSTTGCAALDTVVVNDLRAFPDANAGSDVELGCTEDFVLLDGSGSVNDANVSYRWTDEDGNELAAGLTFQATEFGTYVLEALNSQSGCVATDTVLVVPSDEFPQVQIGDDQTLTCLNDTLSLTAQVTNAPDFTFQWVARGGGQFVPGTETELNPRVTAAGVYELVVTNTQNQCVASDSLVITEDRVLPEAEAGEGGTLTCDDNSLTLDGTGSATGENISYTWTLGGVNVALDTLRVEVTEAGTYLLEVVNRETGCRAVDSVVVALDSNIPQIELDTVPALNCVDETVTLAPAITPAGGNLTYEWAAVGGAGLVGPANGPTASVNAAGTYQLSVTNPDNGCVTTEEFIVTSNRDDPQVSAGPDRTITCRDTVAILDGSASSSGATFTYQWTAVSGGAAPDDATSAQASVRAAGTYALLVTNTANGCSATDTVQVSQSTQLPQVSIAEPSLLSCTAQSVTLDGSASEFGANFTAEWTGPNGEPVSATAGNPLRAAVSQPGAYQLLIRNNDTGCENTASVTVEADASLPVADAGGDQILPCPGQPLTLNGGNSSTGPDITYQWTVVQGTGTITNPTAATASVTQPGAYQLEVRNTSNGCNATATVVVTLDPVLVPADAGEDMSVCDANGELFATLPDGATGRWTNSAGVKINAPDQASTFVEGLNNGDNVFVWTLSRANCPNYSTDEVIIRKEIAPVANNDLATVPAGSRNVEINFAANDQVNTSGQWQLALRTQPTLGVVNNLTNGRGTYVPRAGIFGIDEFSYELCNLSCPELCDTAFVQVTVDFDEGFQPQLPNAITPNGDGINDELVFDILENAIDFWPDNQLIIFNRWGDIVYQVKPYTNNWRGTNSAGLELPDGTYYYILRLDISNGVIYKGDITILK